MIGHMKRETLLILILDKGCGWVLEMVRQGGDLLVANCRISQPLGVAGGGDGGSTSGTVDSRHRLKVHDRIAHHMPSLDGGGGSHRGIEGGPLARSECEIELVGIPQGVDGSGEGRDLGAPIEGGGDDDIGAQTQGSEVGGDGAVVHVWAEDVERLVVIHAGKAWALDGGGDPNHVSGNSGLGRGRRGRGPGGRRGGGSGRGRGIFGRRALFRRGGLLLGLGRGRRGRGSL